MKNTVADDVRTPSPRHDPAAITAECDPDIRLTPALASKRRRMEGKPQHFGDGKKLLPLQTLDSVFSLARRVLEITGLYGRLAARATRFDLVDSDVFVPRLPEALDGLRILHLSDLHIDGTPGFGRRLAACCADLEFDLACITGDLRLDIKGPIDGVLREMRPLAAVLDRGLGAWCVLGNHDCLDLVQPLEEMGLRYLLNESRVLEFGGCPLYVAGVDDAHYFGTDDIDRAFEDVPVEATTLFLCHSPDLIEDASERSADFYMCGHTHGGQLCLPGGRPIVSNANCGRRYTANGWRHGSMRGYTSRGVGFSGVPLRSFCTAEVTVHTLHPERRNPCRLDRADVGEARR